MSAYVTYTSIAVVRFGRKFCSGRILSLKELLGESDVGVEYIDIIVAGAAAAAWCLHGAGCWETASCDDANAGFVVHHFHEECTGGVTDAVGKLGYLRKCRELSSKCYSPEQCLLLPMGDLRLVVLG
jgi:hypothetical protein